MSEFEDFIGLSGVIGAIDGTHIHRTPSGENETDSANRKSSYSIILQALCRHDRLFIDINLDGLEVSLLPGLGSSGTLKFVNAMHSYVIQIILQEIKHTHSHQTR